MTNRSSKAIPWIFQHVVKPVHLRLREALPPAYTEWIAHAWLATLAPTLEVAA